MDAQVCRALKRITLGSKFGVAFDPILNHENAPVHAQHPRAPFRGCYTCRCLGVVVKNASILPPTFRFGVFELNLQSGELRKQGMKIRLQGQPVEILALLLKYPGEVVTREELQKKLWPADTFVDFEQGLNNAMKRLRAALDDSAETPRFIEAIPRRGYRFIGEIRGEPVSVAIPPSSTVRLANWRKWSIWLAVIGMAGFALLLSAAYTAGPRPRSPWPTWMRQPRGSGNSKSGK